MRVIRVNNSPYEEIKIGDTVFKLDLSDEALQRYRTEFAEFANLDKNLSYESVMAVVQKIVDSIFCDTPFDEFYAACGHRLPEMIKALNAVSGIFRELLGVA